VKISESSSWSWIHLPINFLFPCRNGIEKIILDHKSISFVKNKLCLIATLIAISLLLLTGCIESTPPDKEKSGIKTPTPDLKVSPADSGMMILKIGVLHPQDFKSLTMDVTRVAVHSSKGWEDLAGKMTINLKEAGKDGVFVGKRMLENGTYDKILLEIGRIIVDDGKGKKEVITPYKNIQINQTFDFSDDKNTTILLQIDVGKSIISTGVTEKYIFFPSLKLNILSKSREIESLFEKRPERIVSLSPANTEILFAVGAGDEVVAVTDYSNYPPEAVEREKVGGFTTVNIEKIISLKPDLVVAEKANGNEVIEKIESMGIPVMVFEAKTVEDVISNIMLAGKAAGDENKTREVIKKINSSLDKVKEAKSAKPTVLVVVWHEPIYVAGRDTFISDVIERAGGVNVASNIEGFKAIGYEDLIAMNPNIIVVSSGHGTYAALVNNSVLKDVKAIKNNRVYQMNPDILNRPGPRIAEAIETLYGMFYES